MKSHLILLIGFLALPALSLQSQPTPATAVQTTQKTEETPTNFEWYAQQGKQFLQNNRFGQAIEMYRKAIELRPEDYDSLFNLGQSYFSIGKFQEGLEVAQKAVQISPASANAHFLVGNILAAMQRHGEAVEEYNKTNALNPNSTYSFYNLGTSYLSTKQFDLAIKALKEAVRLNPNYGSAHMNLAVAYLEMKQDDDGINELKQALKYDVRAFYAAERLAKECLRRGRYQEAKEAYEWSLQNAPFNAQTCELHTFASTYAGRSQEAIEYGQNCLKTRDRTQSKSTYLALFTYLNYRQINNDAEAQKLLVEAASQLKADAWPMPVWKYLKGEIKSKDLLKSAKNNDELTEAHAYLGCALALEGKKEEAVQHFKWVQENGNQNFVEYPLALMELSRIEANLSIKK